jgi:hypothetical protein
MFREFRARLTARDLFLHVFSLGIKSTGGQFERYLIDDLEVGMAESRNCWLPIRHPMYPLYQCKPPDDAGADAPTLFV